MSKSDPLFDEMGRPAPPREDEGVMALEDTLRSVEEARPRPWLKAHEIEDFLGQTKMWRNKDNEDIKIETLEADYALNILWFLEKKAPELLDVIHNEADWAAAMMDDGGPPWPRETDPVGWMRRTELYKAIAQQAYRVRAH